MHIFKMLFYNDALLFATQAFLETQKISEPTGERDASKAWFTRVKESQHPPVFYA